MEHTGSTAVEKSALHAIVEKNVDIMDGVGMDSAPPLKGYVRFVSKPSADTILSFDPKDPLLVRWQYGLGRAVVFTSDAKSRWAADWVGWKGFDKLWTNIFRDLLPHSETGEAKVAVTDHAGRRNVMPNVIMHDFVNAGSSREIVSLNHPGLRAHLV